MGEIPSEENFTPLQEGNQSIPLTDLNRISLEGERPFLTTPYESNNVKSGKMRRRREGRRRRRERGKEGGYNGELLREKAAFWGLSRRRRREMKIDCD